MATPSLLRKRYQKGEGFQPLSVRKRGLTWLCLAPSELDTSCYGDQRVKEGDSPSFLFSQETPPAAFYASLRPPTQGHGPAGAGLEATRVLRGLEHRSYRNRQRAAGIQTREKKALGRPYCLTAAFQYLKDPVRKVERDSLSGGD